MKKTYTVFFSIAYLMLAIFYLNKYANNFKTSEHNVVGIQKAKNIAKLITVRITVNQSSGSGVIVEKSGNRYIVATNRHVVVRGNEFTIQTHDGYFHPSILIYTSKNNDLALLQYESDRKYDLAAVNTGGLPIKAMLLASGFPAKKKNIQTSIGQLQLYLDRPLKNGYQIGYSNQVESGMSGGAIVNLDGEVIGINGRSANPIIRDYQYQDKTYPNQQLQKQMTQLSWGIPIVEAVELLSAYRATIKKSKTLLIENSDRKISNIQIK